MTRVTLLIGLVVLLQATAGCDACTPPVGPSPSTPDLVTPVPVMPECTPGLAYCDGAAAFVCSDEGTAERIEICAESEVCVDAACEANQVCAPGEVHCVADAVYTCLDDGTGYDRLRCDNLLCADGECVPPSALVCVPGVWQCVGNSAGLCDERGSGWVVPYTSCGDRAVCVDGSCVEELCDPGAASCDGDLAQTCNGLGTGFSVVERCAPPTSCVEGRCQELVCPQERFCDGTEAVRCNAQLTQEVLRFDCGLAGCRDGTCLGVDAGGGRDAGSALDAGPDDRPRRDRSRPDWLVSDVSLDDLSSADLAGRDLRAYDHAWPDVEFGDGRRGDAPPSCLEVACVGLTWCDAVSGHCRPGCGADRQCPPDQRCELALHVCVPLDAGARDALPGVDHGVTGGDAAGGVDGAGVYTPDGGGIIVEELCPAEDIVSPGCMGEMDEGDFWLCDGLDNDCDGSVDEGCPCRRGEVQRCFRGPPGRHDIGACEDGLQSCVSPITSPMPTPIWGPCLGGIAPTVEVCDSLDNDCNGCTDEIEGCDVEGSCPGPGDPRVPEGTPFSTYALEGIEFYQGDDAEAWSWSVTGTPCDRKFLDLPGSVASPTNGQLSYTLSGATQPQASLSFTLSGDYTVTLEVQRAGGHLFTCTWIVHVRAPGLRVEACWDVTGPTADRFGGALDLDLHLGKTGLTNSWFDTNDCDYMTCQSSSELHTTWGYPASQIANCTGPGSRGMFFDSCPNPRLDIDNIYEVDEYVPENINLDNPLDGDRFRVMVHHYDFEDRGARPLVNVYCGGELRGTYGAVPDLVDDFDQGGGRREGSMWRVVDVVMEVDAQGVTSDCDLTPLIDPETLGYFVSVDDPRY